MNIGNRIERAILLAMVMTWLPTSAAYEGKAENKLHVVYLTHADRAPRAGYEARLDRIMKDIQAFYRDEMKRNGYGPMTFPLELDSDGKVVVRMVKLDKDYPESGKLDGRFMKESIRENFAKSGIDTGKSYYIVFQNAYRRDGEKEVYDTLYTGSGGPVSGQTWCVDHELLDIANLVPGRNAVINDRGHRMKANQFCVKMIGGAAHELGHGLGLPHNREVESEFRIRGRALMGGGNYTYRNERIGEGKGAHLTPAHALALSSHPLFKRSEDGRFELPVCTLRELKFSKGDKALKISGKVEGTAPVYGLVIYNDELPTGINKDYDAASYAARVAPDGSFSATVDRLRKAEFGLHLCFYFTNGTHRKFSFTYKVDDQLVPDLAALDQGLAWIQIEAAFHGNDYPGWRKFMPMLPEGHPRHVQARIYGELLKGWSELKTPAAIPAQRKKVVLSDTRFENAAVGWMIPGLNGIFDNNGRKFESLATGGGAKSKGFYGHAYSRYVYDLGNKWRKLSVGYGLQVRHPGSVVFVIKGDGKELFRSDVVNDAKDRKVTVDVGGVRRLELIVEDGGDGRDADWGVWFDPVLTR